ncbi:MAG: hypothetical protein WCF18_18740 [Chthoniobacteraceae bacterium]
MAGTVSYSLDLRVDCGGRPISGLQYYFATSPASGLTFGAPAVTSLNNPFVSSDIFLGPSSGASVNQAGATTIWFKGSAGDYPTFAGNSIGRYLFNTALLSPGVYVISPFGEEFTYSNTTVTTFGLAGAFTLTVITVPEPGSLALGIVGALVILARRGRALVW